MNTRGFSLVELSIVLVILGLLVGGILAGQSLIRASELRSVTSDVARYATATTTFRDKYFSFPGDMTNATSFWGKNTTLCNAQPGSAGTPGTCNGDGNGFIGDAVGGASEGYRAWTQLALAGLTEGNYNGTQTGWGTNAMPGVDIPASRISTAGYTFVTFSQSSSINGEFGYSDLPDMRNSQIMFGARGATMASIAILKGEEAWNIDGKMDDGLPAKGKVRGGAPAVCTTGATSASIYVLNSSSVVCSLSFFIN